MSPPTFSGSVPRPIRARMIISVPRMPVTKFGLYSSASRPIEPVENNSATMVGSDSRRMKPRNGLMVCSVIVAPFRSRVTSPAAVLTVLPLAKPMTSSMVDAVPFTTPSDTASSTGRAPGRSR